MTLRVRLISLVLGLVCMTRAETVAQQTPTKPGPLTPAQPGVGAAQSRKGMLFMQAVMERSAKLANLNQQIDRRKDRLYEQHPEVRALRRQMLALQKKIDALFAKDGKLARLTQERNMLLTVMPAVPPKTVAPLKENSTSETRNPK